MWTSTRRQCMWSRSGGEDGPTKAAAGHFVLMEREKKGFAHVCVVRRGESEKGPRKAI